MMRGFAKNRVIEVNRIASKMHEIIIKATVCTSMCQTVFCEKKSRIRRAKQFICFLL